MRTPKRSCLRLGSIPIPLALETRATALSNMIKSTCAHLITRPVIRYGVQVQGKYDRYHLNPFMTNGLHFFHSSDRSIFNIRAIWLGFEITMFYIETNAVVNANSVDPYQTLRSAAFDLGLHCLSMLLL